RRPAGRSRERRARCVRAASLAALPGLPRRAGDVRGAVVVLVEAAAALRGERAVRAAVWPVPLRGGVRARARRRHRLPRLRLADDGPGAVAAAGCTRPVLAVEVASRADGARAEG